MSDLEKGEQDVEHEALAAAVLADWRKAHPALSAAWGRLQARARVAPDKDNFNRIRDGLEEVVEIVEGRAQPAQVSRGHTREESANTPERMKYHGHEGVHVFKDEVQLTPARYLQYRAYESKIEALRQLVKNAHVNGHFVQGSDLAEILTREEKL